MRTNLRVLARVQGLENITFILQGRLIAPFFVWSFCAFSGLLVRILGLFCVLLKRRIDNFHRAQIVKFVSFTGAFTGIYVVKSVKEACEFVLNTPKEACQHVTQLD